MSRSRMLEGIGEPQPTPRGCACVDGYSRDLVNLRGGLRMHCIIKRAIRGSSRRRPGRCTCMEGVGGWTLTAAARALARLWLWHGTLWGVASVLMCTTGVTVPASCASACRRALEATGSGPPSGLHASRAQTRNACAMHFSISAVPYVGMCARRFARVFRVQSAETPVSCGVQYMDHGPVRATFYAGARCLRIFRLSCLPCLFRLALPAYST